MARRRSPVLTDAETRLMKVLWSKDRATVADVMAAAPGHHHVAYTTVQTMLHILERKGYVTHERVGRAFVYRPVVEQRTARRRAVVHLTKVLFDGSPSLLVRNLLEDDGIEPAERERLKRLVTGS
jgi:predicted transcriptional regulator